MQKKQKKNKVLDTWWKVTCLTIFSVIHLTDLPHVVTGSGQSILREGESILHTHHIRRLPARKA